MDLLPLTPASFQILLVLVEQDAHGYAIMQEVTRMTEGAASLGPGTLYRTIQKLLDDQLIEAIGTDADDRRVPYRITSTGIEIARAEAQRLAMLVRLAEKRRLLAVGRRPRPRGAHV